MKKTSPKIIEWFDLGIFPGVVMFSNGMQYDEIIIELNKIKAEQWILGIGSPEDKQLIDNGNAFGLYRSIENTKTGRVVNLFYIILKKPFEYSSSDYIILAHEALHIVQFFSEGVFDRKKEIECEAYLHSHIMRKCIESLDPKPQKTPKRK